MTVTPAPATYENSRACNGRRISDCAHDGNACTCDASEMSRMQPATHQRSRARELMTETPAHATYQKFHACNLQRISDCAHELMTVTPAAATHQKCRACTLRRICDRAHELMTLTPAPATHQKCHACNMPRISDRAHELMTVTPAPATHQKRRA